MLTDEKLKVLILYPNENAPSDFPEFPENDDSPSQNFVVDEEKYFGIGVGIGLRQGQEELKQRLNGALKKLINSGDLESYARKIFPFKLHKDEWGQ